METLLDVEDLPPGYSQDPPTAAGPTKTFCDYKPPAAKQVYVSRDFTKGGGLSAEIVRLGLREYESVQKATAAFKALTQALETCTGETYEGSKLTYARMSTAKVGDEALGVKITVDDSTLLQNFVRVGPTLISTGGGGLLNTDADEVTALLRDQTRTYEAAATR